MKISPDIEKKLFKAALEVKKNSYSPYSGYKVASSLLTSKKKIFSGVNIENASYGGTICAERSAIFTAVSAGEKDFSAILVLTDEKQPWPPCGLCRQIMTEFFNPNTHVFLANKKGIQKRLLFSDLMPMAFDSSKL